MKSNDGKSKKPYHSPDLVVYGTIHEITKTGGSGGMLDGGPEGQPTLNKTA